MSCARATTPPLLEEETTTWYDPSAYYPVYILQTLHGRYTTAVKLGYGAQSTSYKTVKVGTYKPDDDQSQEIKVLDHLKNVGLSHNGRYRVRRACDYFKIQIPGGGHHPCSVYEPLGISLSDYLDLQPSKSKRLDTPMVKWISADLLLAMEYLHASGVIHTDIKLNNVHCTLPADGDAILRSLVDAEHHNPSPRKVAQNRLIYTSRAPEWGHGFGCPILCDLGVSRFGQEEYDGVIQPNAYRAPEVMLGMKWNSSVDIWNLGGLIWELLCGERLFGGGNEQDCLAKMITYLGPAPRQFLDRCHMRSKYFDCGPVSLQFNPLKDRLEGDGDMDLFLDFVLSMLLWEPEKRKTAAELRQHPWLKPVAEMGAP